MSNQMLLAWTQSNTCFSREVPGFQFAWDSTSLGLLKTCPYKYFLKQIRQLESKYKRAPLTFGTYIHSGLEQYDKELSKGKSIQEALESTIEWLARETMGRDYIFSCPDCGSCDVIALPTSHPDKVHEFESKSMPLFECPQCSAERKMVLDLRPYTTMDKLRNRFALIRTIVWYVDHYHNDPTKTIQLSNGKPAVELSFKIPLEKSEALAALPDDLYLCGHLDRVVEFAGQNFVQDRKTTVSQMDKRFFDGFTPGNQMSCYSLGGLIALGIPIHGVMIDGIKLLTYSTEFHRGFAPRSKDLTAEWHDDLLFWIELAYLYARRQHWPMNDESCSKYGGCEFQSCCAASPALREAHLSEGFKVRETPWNPLIPR